MFNQSISQLLPPKGVNTTPSPAPPGGDNGFSAAAMLAALLVLISMLGFAPAANAAPAPSSVTFFPRTVGDPLDLIWNGIQHEGNRIDRPTGKPWGALPKLADTRDTEFVGWEVSAKFAGGSLGLRDMLTSTDIADNRYSVKPVFKAKTYSLSFSNVDGSKPDLKWGAVKPSANGTIEREAGKAWGSLPAMADTQYEVFEGWALRYNPTKRISPSTRADANTTAVPVFRAKAFVLEFHANAQIGKASGSMAAEQHQADCADCALPKAGFSKTTGAPAMIDTEAGESGDVRSKFMGWSRDPDAKVATYLDQASAAGFSTTDGEVIKLYAVWDDAPRFNKTYSDRYFTLREARTGKITEEELLKSISATDRETNPLVAKTKADVAASGSDVGITLHDFDADDYTRLNGEATITVTYKLKDEASNVAFLRIKVNVSPSRADLVEMTKSTRGMSEKFLGASPEDGGLDQDSSWRTDPSKRESLERAVRSETGTKYCLSSDAVNELREQVRNGEVGKTGGSGGLESTKQAMREGSCS